MSVTPALFRCLVEHSPEAILVLDARGIVRYASPATERVFARTPEQAVGQRVFDWLNVEHVASFATLFESCLQAPEQVVFVSGYYPHAHSDVELYGEGRLCNRLDDPDVRGVLFYFRERSAELGSTTDWGQEHSLRVPVMNALPDQIAVKNRRGQLVTANEAAFRARGCRSAQELFGKTDWEFLPGDLAHVFEQHEQQVLRSGEAILGVELAVPIPGERLERWFSTGWVPLFDPDGSVVGVVCICHDITTQRAANEELRRAREAAEAASQAKSEFLATVSHEIRTPMNAILNLTALALDTDLNDRQRGWLTTVHDEAQWLLCIINDILDFSKIEAGELKLEPIPFAPREELKLILRPLLLLAERKGLYLGYSITQEVPELLRGDRKRLRQVINNLVGNAIKFTDQGEVRLLVTTESPGRAELGDKSDQVTLLFEVRDTGIGIPPNKLASIFEPFVQVDSSTTRKYGGSGLGLAISARLVALMDGTIDVESVPGQGSCFRFTARFETHQGPVPRLDQPQQGGSAPQGSRMLRLAQSTRARESALLAPGNRSLLILLAEDYPANQEVASYLLEQWGHAVLLAENGREAVARAEAEAGVDLILMDVQMPEMDGLQATRVIRASEAARGRSAVPIIGLSAHAMRGDRDRCLASGMNDYVTKPIDQRELFAAIQRVIDGRFSAPPAVPEPVVEGNFEIERALASSGDRATLVLRIERFLDRQQAARASLRQALERREGPALRMTAHRFAGGDAGLFCSTIKHCATELEQLAGQEQYEQAGEVLARLDALVEQLIPQLRAYLTTESQ